MNEAWRQWEGEVADGKFVLRQYLGDSERGPVFLTEFPTESGEQEPVKAAIKLIPAEAQTADAQLARWAMAANLGHPHLLGVLRTGRCQIGGARLLYVVMELADEDLSHVVPKRALTAVEAQELLRPVLEALAYLHGKGLVHGHVKPANIVAVGEQVKISSDGICAARDAGAGAHAVRPSAYDAPEAGTRGYSAAGDVWSLGVTLVEVLAQQLPVWEWKGQEEPALPKLPAPFGDIARQCLRRDPQRRCTLAEIATRLDPDAPALGKLKLIEQVAIPPAAIPQAATRVPSAPKVAEVAKPRVESLPKRASAANAQTGSPKRSYAIPAIAIGVVALAAIFAAPKLLHHGAEASPETAASPTEDLAASTEQPQPKPTATNSASSTDRPAPRETDASSDSPARETPSSAPATRSVAGDSSRGSVAHQVLPEASPSALATIQGAVRVGVRVQVDASGKVAGADLDSPGPSKYFANLALKAARAWEFQPARANGEAASSAWILRFEFAQDGAKVSSAQPVR
jgi:eukaryotic-like serine/threonine-protein kinase